MDSGVRLQTTVQLYFIYAYKILRGLSLETIRTLDRYIALIVLCLSSFMQVARRTLLLMEIFSVLEQMSLDLLFTSHT